MNPSNIADDIRDLTGCYAEKEIALRCGRAADLIESLQRELAAAEARVKRLQQKELSDFDTIAAQQARIDEAHVLINRNRVALDDWLNTYASELCDKARVTEAKVRICELGTIGYIAHIQKANRHWLSATPAGSKDQP